VELKYCRYLLILSVLVALVVLGRRFMPPQSSVDDEKMTATAFEANTSQLQAFFSN